MLESVNARTVSAQKAAAMSPEELAGKIVVGRIVNCPREDYVTRYKRIITEQSRELR
jgi:hypothetical protein